MWLPTGGLDDLGDGGALLAAEHGDQLGLLASVASLARCGRVARRGRGLERPAPFLLRGLDRARVRRRWRPQTDVMSM